MRPMFRTVLYQAFFLGQTHDVRSLAKYRHKSEVFRKETNGPRAKQLGCLSTCRKGAHHKSSTSSSWNIDRLFLVVRPVKVDVRTVHTDVH